MTLNTEETYPYLKLFNMIQNKFIIYVMIMKNKQLKNLTDEIFQIAH